MIFPKLISISIITFLGIYWFQNIPISFAVFYIYIYIQCMNIAYFVWFKIHIRFATILTHYFWFLIKNLSNSVLKIRHHNQIWTWSSLYLQICCWLQRWMCFSSTVWCCYNAVNFLTNIHKRHPIAHLLGRGMGCLLWIQHLIDILPQFL